MVQVGLFTHALCCYIEETFELDNGRPILVYFLDMRFHPVGQLAYGALLSETFVAQNYGAEVVLVSNDSTNGLIDRSISLLVVPQLAASLFNISTRH